MNYQILSKKAYFWTLQGLCALHRKPFSLELAQQQLSAPYSNQTLISAMNEFGLQASTHKCKAEKLHKESFPLIVWLKVQETPSIVDGEQTDSTNSKEDISPALVLQAD
jgi:subfamily B ATP-binding cassette protein HlyB/CyaB